MQTPLSLSTSRCAWVPLSDPLCLAYHDQEWGVPQRDDHTLFAFLALETVQAGLSWTTILHKRSGYEACFEGLDPAAIARFDEAKIQALCQDARIIRHERKVRTIVHNAHAFLALQASQGSFADFLWSFVGGEPVVNRPLPGSSQPPFTPLAVQVTKALKAHGFKGVGPTTVYAYLQATGVVNDHAIDCFRCPPKR